MNRWPYRRIALSIALFVVLFTAVLWLADLALPLAHADPGTLFVKPTGSGTACTAAAPCTLATALAQARTGDTVYLAAGTYTGSGSAVITVTRSITLLCGWDGSMAYPVVRDPDRYVSVIDGQNQRRGICIDGAGRCTVDGCTVVRGNATSAPWPGQGGGIYSRQAAPLLANNTVSTCVASTSAGLYGYGGGIYVLADPGTSIVANTVQGNTAAAAATGYGGGICVSSGPGAVVRGNRIVRNTASITGGLGYGGGLLLQQAAEASVVDNVITDNVAQAGTAPAYGSEGGGVSLSESHRVTLRGNKVLRNTASIPANGTGGGISLSLSHDVVVQGNVLQENLGSASLTTGAGRGGALTAYGCRRVLLDANQLLGNRASQSTWGYGGALYFCRSTSFTMTNDIVAGNHASNRGGGIAFETSATEPVTGTLLHNTFVNNKLGSGAGQYAIHVNAGRVTLSLTNNLFSGHAYAVFGHDESTVIMNRSLFWDNSAGDVGGGNVLNTAPITGLDPLLTADYHLRPGSPAIDAGLPVGVTRDIDGDLRPRGPLPDIGADEWLPRGLYLPLVRKR